MTNKGMKDGEAFLYMKVGVHAKEPLEEILVRKRKEIEKAGVAFWGYGGNTCHPVTAVRPFVSTMLGNGAASIRLLMEEINSNHFADQVRAEKYSINGVDWIEVPKGVNVLGSRYALVLKTLDTIDMTLSLAQTQVGVGRLSGSLGSNYVRGRVDKACLVYQQGLAADSEFDVRLSLAAELTDPYAVLLK